MSGAETLKWIEEVRREAALAERERIAKAIEHEADVCPCAEDEIVLRDTARLVRADFSYDEAERLAEAEEAVPCSCGQTTEAACSEATPILPGCQVPDSELSR